MIEIPEKMLAVRNHGPKNYKLETVETPKPGFREIVAKVEMAGICGSDVHCFDGAPTFWNSTNPWVKTPVIPGHEFICRVVALGEEAEEYHKVKLNDRIIAEQIVPCWKCKYCKTGNYHLCEVNNVLGFQKKVNGCWAEYIKFTADAIIYQVPEEFSMEDAVYIEPFACALHVVEQAKLKFSDTVVLAGAGPLGLAIVQGLKLKTPKKIVVIDLNENRLKLAKKLGATIVLNPTHTDVVEEVRKITNDHGCDVYIEASGHKNGVTQAMPMLKKTGRYVQFSVLGEEVTTDWTVINRKELEIIGAHLSPYTYSVAIDLLQKKLITSEGIITHKLPLKEFISAMEKTKSADSIKVVLLP